MTNIIELVKFEIIDELNTMYHDKCQKYINRNIKKYNNYNEKIDINKNLSIYSWHADDYNINLLINDYDDFESFTIQDEFTYYRTVFIINIEILNNYSPIFVKELQETFSKIPKEIQRR